MTRPLAGAPALPPPRRPRLRRRGLHSLLALLLLATGALASVAAPTPAAATGGPLVPYANPSEDAAAWLVDRFDANGETWSAAEHADFIFALAATNGSRAEAIRSLELMEAATPAYINPGGGTFVNHGATSKVMLAVQTLGGDPNDFAGFDLEQILRDAIVTEGANTGQVGNVNLFSQPLAIMALARTEGGAPPVTGTYLVDRQCPDGGFGWNVNNCSTADADYTGIIASALITLGLTDATEAALDWLEDHQAPDGGFFASNSPGDSNTNSTGLAAQALRAAGRTASADGGAEYVYDAQITGGENAGAIPWKPGTPGSLFLATTQGVLAWGAPTYAELAFPTVVGEPCPPAEGVTMVVDLAHFDDTIRVACAPGPHENGTSAMQTAGFEIGWHPDYPGGGPGLGGAVCQIDGHPEAGYPECWYVGFWSYWHARPDAQWVFSGCGIDNRTPRQGSIDAWRYEPDVNRGRLAAPPLIDAHFPRVDVEVPGQVDLGESATVAVSVLETVPRVSPGPGDPGEPCYLPPDTEPEDHDPEIAGPVTSGLVEIRVDGEAVGDPLPLDEAGEATLDLDLGTGGHEVTAHFLGTATDFPARSTGADVVVTPPTATALEADETSVVIGQDVTLTATVAVDEDGDDATPVTEGEVEFRIDDEPLGDPVALDEDGRAEVPTSFDELGTVSATAHYLGAPGAGQASDSEPVEVEVVDGASPNEVLVRALYQAVLEREPDPDGLAWWVDRLDAGADPARLAETLARTREGWQKVVEHQYRLALQRDADIGGREHWTDELQRTNRPDELLTQLFASPEVYERAGGTNSGYVTYLYQRILDRTPDQAGLDHWVDRLDRATVHPVTARRSVARTLMMEPEALARQVDASHRQVCGGNAPPEARAELAAAFQASRLNHSTLRAAIVIRGCPA